MSTDHRALAVTLTAQRFLSNGYNPYNTARIWCAAADCHDSIIWSGDVR
jgi:hypothetical protein